MLREKTGLGPGLLFAVLFSSLLGIGNQQLPYLAAKYGGASGYLGLLGAFGLGIFMSKAAVDLQKRFPEKSLVEYAPLILGRVLGKLSGFLYLSFLLFLLVWSLRSAAEAINLYYLQRTPIWIIALLLVLAVTYLTLRGAQGVAKTAAFILPLAFFFTVLTLIMSFQNFSYDRIAPVYHLHTGTLVAASHLFYAFFPLALVFSFLPYLTVPGKGMSVILRAAGTVAVIFFFFIVACIGMYGALGVVRYGWPITELSRTIHIPYLLESFGLFYSVTWLSQIYIGAGACFFALAQGLTQLFSCWHYKWFMLVLWPIIIALVILPDGVIQVRQFFDYFRLFGFVILLAIPVLLWLTAKVSQREEVS